MLGFTGQHFSMINTNNAKSSRTHLCARRCGLDWTKLSPVLQMSYVLFTALPPITFDPIQRYLPLHFIQCSATSHFIHFIQFIHDGHVVFIFNPNLLYNFNRILVLYYKLNMNASKYYENFKMAL